MWLFSAPSTKRSLLQIMPKRYQKVSKLSIIQNMVLILWIKWQGNTRLELPPEDGLFICLKTHWTWRIVCKAVTKNNIPRRVFLQQLAQDLSGPHIDEKSNTKKRPLQEETFDEKHNKMTKYCQVTGECKKNRRVGTCHEYSKSLCGKCTAKTVRLCVKCSYSQ